MSWLKWYAAILNRIYGTTIFNAIIIDKSKEKLNYAVMFHTLYSLQDNSSGLTLHPDRYELLTALEIVSLSKDMNAARDKVFWLYKYFPKTEVNEENGYKQLDYTIYHVALFSCLSKCSIWPNMLRNAKGFVPRLAEFYNKFFYQFSADLDYKFDPLFPSHKQKNLVQRIKQKRLHHPQLFYAIYANDHPRITQLLDGNEDILNTARQGELAVTHWAAAKSSLYTIKLLFKHGADFALLDNEQQTPLFHAVQRLDLYIVRYLVEEISCNVNHSEYQNRTPLYLAAFEGHLEIVKYLVSKGADPNVESKLRRTPLSKACYLGNHHVVEYLIGLGVPLESIDSKGRTALHNAAWGSEGGREGKRRGEIKLYDSPYCVKLLLKAGHRVDVYDFDKFTPLFSAISSKGERSLHLLVQAGANLNHKTAKKYSCVFIAAKYGHLSVLKILIEQYKCEFMYPNYQYFTPLYASLTLYYPHCSFYLLDLYHYRKYSFDFLSVIKCLYTYDKPMNLKYVIDWLASQYNISKLQLVYISLNSKHETETGIKNLMEYIRDMGSRDLVNQFIKLVIQLLCLMKYEEIFYLAEIIANKWSAYYSAIEWQLACVKLGLTIPSVPLNHFCQYQQIIYLLDYNSAFTNDIKGLKDLLLQIVKNQLTRVLIWLLKSVEDTNCGTRGIYRWTKEYVMVALQSSDEGSLSISEYCAVNGSPDTLKIILEYTKSNLYRNVNRTRIPEYDYTYTVSKYEGKIYRLSIYDSNKLFEYTSLRYMMSSEERILFSEYTLFRYIDFAVVSVDSLDELAKMYYHLKDKLLVGVDVYHFTNNHEQFVCLVQVSAGTKVFLIDPFKISREHIAIFIRRLFASYQVKILHSYDNDLRWLREDFGADTFRRVVDTAKIYSMIGTYTNSASLKTLADRVLGYQISKDYQRSDWRIRPLFEYMKNYATNDAKLLSFIFIGLLRHLTSASRSKIVDYFSRNRPIKTNGRSNCLSARLM